MKYPPRYGPKGDLRFEIGSTVTVHGKALRVAVAYGQDVYGLVDPTGSTMQERRPVATHYTDVDHYTDQIIPAPDGWVRQGSPDPGDEFWYERSGRPDVQVFPAEYTSEGWVLYIGNTDETFNLPTPGEAMKRYECLSEFGPHEDHSDCERMLHDMANGCICDDAYNREAEETMLGRPLFPNEY